MESSALCAGCLMGNPETMHSGGGCLEMRVWIRPPPQLAGSWRGGSGYPSPVPGAAGGQRGRGWSAVPEGPGRGCRAGCCLNQGRKCLEGLGHCGGGALPVVELGSGGAERRGDGDPPLTGPRTGFAHVGLNPFLRHVALQPRKKRVPGF